MPNAVYYPAPSMRLLRSGSKLELFVELDIVVGGPDEKRAFRLLESWNKGERGLRK